MAQEAYEELFQNSTLPRPMEVNEFEQVKRILTVFEMTAISFQVG